MNDVSVNLALIGRLIRWRWPVLMTLLIVGGLVGAGASFVLSPGYVSSTKVLLQGSRDATQLPAETQVATSLIVLDRAAHDLGGTVTGTDLQHHVSALVDGNVITISGAAGTPQRAQQIAAQVTTEYIKFSTQIVTDVANATADSTQKSRQTIQQQIDDANKRITQLQASPSITAPGPDGDQARAELQQVQQTITKASKDMEQIDGAAESAALNSSLGASSATIIELATLPGSLGSPTPVECVLGAALAAAFVGLIVHLVLLRTDRRLRAPSEVESAAGAPVLGAVEVASDAAGLPLARRLLHDDRRWAYTTSSVAEDDRGRLARYQRILRKLEQTSPGRTVLAVTADEDRSAREVLVGLATAAATGDEPVVLVTSDDELAVHVGLLSPEGGRIIAGPGATGPTSALTFIDVRVAVARAVVPDAPRVDMALLLVSAGTRTGWELAAVAGACFDAGQPLGGVVVAVPRIGAGFSPPQAPEGDVPVVPGDPAMVVSS